MLLKELFDEVVEYKGPFNNNGLVIYTFKIDDLNYIVKFTDVKVENVEYDFSKFDTNATHATEISFGINLGYKVEMGVSKTGNSIPVFSTVLDIIKKYLKSSKAEFIIFSAKEKSREKLYNRMTKMVTSKTQYTLVDTFGDSEGKNFILRNK